MAGDDGGEHVGLSILALALILLSSGTKGLELEATAASAARPGRGTDGTVIEFPFALHPTSQPFCAQAWFMQGCAAGRLHIDARREARARALSPGEDVDACTQPSAGSCAMASTSRPGVESPR